MVRVLRVFVGVACAWAAITLLQISSAEPQKQGERVPRSPFDLAVPGEPIAGIPQDKALEIYHRHAEALRTLPGAVSVSFTAQGLVVETINPAALPPAVEGLPVIPVPPSDPRAALTINDDLTTQPWPSSEPIPLPDLPLPSSSHPLLEPPHAELPDPVLPPIAGMPYEQAATIVERHKKELLRVPGVYGVNVGGKGIIISIFIPSNDRTIPADVLQRATAALPSEIEGLPTEISPLAVLPPPPGVVILRADGTREHADSCPAGFEERLDYGWRLCFAPGFAGPIPPLSAPPIAGVPYETALEIHDRHVHELSKLPGVDSVGLGEDGIEVRTTNPAAVPSEIEGLPIKILPPLGPARLLNHSGSNKTRPLRGAVTLRDSLLPGTFVTLTGVASSQGKPWLIFPAHTILNCQNQATDSRS